MSILVGLLALCLAASCGEKKDSGKKEAGPGQDWSGKELKPVETSCGGVKLTIDLPAKMKLDADEADRKAWKADMEDYFSEPGVTLMTISTAPKTLEEATKHYMVEQKYVIARKEEVAGGFLVTHHSETKGLLYAVFFKAIGGKNIVCKASQAKDGGVPNFEKTKGWLEKICLSLKAK
jgi:hypothetical protein